MAGIQSNWRGDAILKGAALGAISFGIFSAAGEVIGELAGIIDVEGTAAAGASYFPAYVNEMGVGAQMGIYGAAGGVTGVANTAINGGNEGSNIASGIVAGAAGSSDTSWSLTRVGAYSLAGGTMGLLSGNGFWKGALFAGGAAFARYTYNEVVGYDISQGPGGPAQPKGFSTMPYGDTNNVGVQGYALSGNFWDDFWLEGGFVSRVANYIPGVNAVAGMHDVFQVKLDALVGEAGRSAFNVPGMIPATVLTTYGQMANPAMLIQYFNRP